jgi:thiamine pyrophosphokinase
VDKVLGVLGGADGSPELLLAWAAGARRLLAADGGADRLLGVGLRPDVIVGDLDSVSPEALACGAAIVHAPEQDLQDAGKLLAYAEREGARSIVLEGVEGDRLDHTLATLGVCAASPLAIRLALRQGVGTVLRAGQRCRAATKPGAVVSLLPIAPCGGVRLEGVVWPLHGAGMALDGQISLSNRATGVWVEAELEAGAALLIVAGEGPSW